MVDAIEQLAAEAADAAPEAAVGRLAGLWAMVARLDPAVAERLAGYAGEAD